MRRSAKLCRRLSLPFSLIPFPITCPAVKTREMSCSRCHRMFQRDREHHPGGRVLIVTHNTLIRVALCHLLGVPLSKYRTVFPSIDNGALSEIELQNRSSLSLEVQLAAGPTGGRAHRA